MRGPRSNRWRSLRREAGRTARWLAAALLFAMALLAGVAAHSNLALSRRVACRILNATLESLFVGRVEASAIDRMTLKEIRLAQVTVTTDQGVRVLQADNLRLRSPLVLQLARQLAGSRGLRLGLHEIRIERAQVTLERGASGLPTLAEAFQLREPPEPEPPDAIPRPVMVVMPHIEMGRIEVRGALPEPVPPTAAFDLTLARLRGSVRVGPGDVVVVNVKQTGLVERVLFGVPIAGSLNAHLRTAPLRSWGDFAGHVGALEVQARAQLDGDELAVTATSPRIGPEQLDSLVPGHPVRVPFVGRLTLEGTPPLLDVSAVAAFPRFDSASRRGGIEARGKLLARAVPLLDLRIDATEVDTRIFGGEALPARLSGQARLQARLSGRDSELRIALDGEGAQLGGAPLPATAGTLFVDTHGVASWLRLQEPDARADATLRYGYDGGLEVAACTELPQVQAVGRLRALLAKQLGLRGLRAGGRLRARARWHQDALDADFRAELRSIVLPSADLAVARADVSGRVIGPMDGLALRAQASGRDLTVYRHPIERFSLSATGPLQQPSLKASASDRDGRRLDASARFATAATELRGVRVRATRGETAVDARLARVAVSPSALIVDGLAVEGLASEPLRGTLRIRDGDLDGRLVAQNVDLDTIRRVLGLRFPLRGQIDVDLDLKRTPEGRTGHVKVALRDGGMLVLSGLQGELEARFDGSHARPRARLALTMPGEAPERASASSAPCGGTIVSVAVDEADTELDGPLLDPQTYLQATGAASVRIEQARLSCLSQVAAMALYPTSQPPLRELGGVANASFRIARTSHTDLPSVQGLELRTEGLRFESLSPKEGEPPWRSDRLDLQLTGHFDGKSGRGQAHAQALDPQPLVDLQTQWSVDVEQLRESKAAALRALLEAPLSVRMGVPRSPFERLASLPEPLRSQVPSVRGEVQLDAHLEGSLRDPHAAVRLRGWGLTYAPPAPSPAAEPPTTARSEGSLGSARLANRTAPNPWAMPLDLDVLATFGSGRATVEGHVDYRGRSVATLEASAAGHLPFGASPCAPGTPRRAVASCSGTKTEQPSPPWTGSVAVRLEEFPLSGIPRLARANVRGKVSGTVGVRDFGSKPKPEVELRIRDFAVGETAKFERAELGLKTADTPDGRTVVANGSLGALGGGSLQAAAYAGVDWDDGWVPRIAMDRAADLLVRARAFPLEVLHPVVEPAVSKLEGTLAGDLRLQWHQIAAVHDVELTADMRVAEGVIHLPQVGQELQNLTARVRTAPGGLVMVQDLSAEAATGRATGWVTARLAGLELVDLSGRLDVAEGEEIPLTVEGVPLGSARGRLLLLASQHPDRINLVLTAVGVHVALPSSPTGSVQPLQDNPDIQLSHPLAPPEPERDPSDLAWHITAAVQGAEIEGNGVRIVLSSAPDDPPQIHLGAETEVRGELVLEDGAFDLLGLGGGIKLFELERGLVRLRSAEPSNPYVNASASYHAPDGSIIYVEYAGNLTPITRDKIRFSSSPPRSQEEILAVLLFGEVQEMEGATGPSRTDDPTARSSTSGGGIAAYQLNALLGGIPSLRGVSTSVGTTEEGYTSTSVRYQLTDGLTAQATYERRSQEAGTESPGEQATSGQTDVESRTELSVDWRFYRDWLIRGSVGVGDDASSGLDLFWQYRY